MSIWEILGLLIGFWIIGVLFMIIGIFVYFEVKQKMIEKKAKKELEKFKLKEQEKKQKEVINNERSRTMDSRDGYGGRADGQGTGGDRGGRQLGIWRGREQDSIREALKSSPNQASRQTQNYATDASESSNEATDNYSESYNEYESSDSNFEAERREAEERAFRERSNPAGERTTDYRNESNSPINPRSQNNGERISVQNPAHQSAPSNRKTIKLSKPAAL